MAAGDGIDAVTAAAVDLYGAPPDGFVAARTARSAALRRAGDRDAAAGVGRLGRPTVAASLVNRLVREQPAVVHALLATGRALRRAQEELDAERLKELGAERRRVVAEAVQAASAIAEADGRPPSPSVLDEVGATCTAAVLDEASGGAVASGRLVHALPADGLEGAPVAELVALPEAPPVLASAPPSRRPAPKRATTAHDDRVAKAARQDAERAVADAERRQERAARAQQDADDDLADAERRRDDAGRRADDLRTRVEELRRRLDAAEDEQRAADQDVRDRRAAERAARRAAEEAADELTRARARLDALG